MSIASHLFQEFWNYLANMNLAEWIRAAFYTVLGIIWVWGSWKAIRYSKAQIVNRLNEFLDSEEENIGSARKALLRRLEYGQTLEQVAVHKTLEEAFALIRSAHLLEAQSNLDAFRQHLLKSAQLAERHRDIASRQAATVLLFMGIIALHRAQMLEAKNYWQQALELSIDDADVLKWTGELETKLGNRAKALECYQAALNSVGTDEDLKADLFWLRSQIHLTNARPFLERSDLGECAPLFFDQGRWQKAGPSFERLGDLRDVHGPMGLVAHSYHQALTSYERAGDRPGAARVRSKLGLDDPDLQPTHPLSRELLSWLKLTAELTILLWGAIMLLS